MTVLSPARLEDALEALRDLPSLTVVAGGTDLKGDVDAGWRRPGRVLRLGRIEELRRWRTDGTELVIGAGLTYAMLLSSELATGAPALAQAARTVASPQVRSTGTIGGNLATASPAGDTLPVLTALDARVELASARSRRLVPVERFLVGPGSTLLAPDELVTAVRVPLASGPQEYLKIGVPDPGVVAMVSCALVVDHMRRRVTCALGSVGPTPIRDRRIESWLSSEVDWDTGRTRHASVAERFGWHMAAAARPHDDARGSAAYRRHAAGVLARRAVERALTGSSVTSWSRGVA